MVLVRAKKHQYLDRARSILAITLVVIGFGSLVIWRLPVQLGFISVAIGVATGALWLSKERTFELAGAALLALGVQYVTERAAGLGPSIEWWQPGLLVVATTCAMHLMASMRRAA